MEYPPQIRLTLFFSLRRSHGQGNQVHTEVAMVDETIDLNNQKSLLN